MTVVNRLSGALGCGTVFILLLCPSLAAAQETVDPAALIERYRQVSAAFYTRMPPPPETLDVMMKDRNAAAAALKAHPDEVITAAEKILHESADSKQRYDVVNILEMFQTRKCADLLHKVLEDVRNPEGKEAATYERLVRLSAVNILRAMSSRAEHDPIVPGLLPYLIAASHDKNEEVRSAAVRALADCREPGAQTMLREILKDPSAQVRFHAACLLTTYQDASGLGEMKLGLARLRAAVQERNPPKEEEFAFWGEVALLVTSFERITGKSFGVVPPSPHILSDSRQIEPTKREYKRLLDTWAQWWDWQPEAPRGG